MGRSFQSLVVDSTLCNLVVFLILVPLGVVRYSLLSLGLFSSMICIYDCYSLFFWIPIPYREHHFCQAPLSFVKRSGLDFFSFLVADSKPLVFLWITKNLS